MSIDEIVQRQDEILEAMTLLRIMCYGTLSQQRYPERAQRKDGQGAVGPYGLWQGSVNGKRFAKRVSGEDAKKVAQGIQTRHTFQALSDEYVDLSCKLAALQGNEELEITLKKGL